MWQGASSRSEAVEQLVLANLIMTKLGLFDSMGHVSVRNPEDPDTHLLSRSKAPRRVGRDDILLFDHDGNEVSGTGKKPYMERVIHGEIYKRRPDVNAVVHCHVRSVLPFSLTDRPVRPVIHTGAMFYNGVPVYDDYDGENEGVYIISQDQGAKLAEFLGSHRAVLLRGHGCVVVGSSLPELTLSTFSLDVNCQVQWATEAVAPAKPLSEAEARLLTRIRLGEIGISRAWENWVEEIRDAGWLVEPGPVATGRSG
jgi:3-hydroxy-2-methylpyridine-4,5-dicarboxylate 4-decarboxylase